MNARVDIAGSLLNAAVAMALAAAAAQQPMRSHL